MITEIKIIKERKFPDLLKRLESYAHLVQKISFDEEETHYFKATIIIEVVNSNDRHDGVFESARLR